MIVKANKIKLRSDRPSSGQFFSSLRKMHRLLSQENLETNKKKVNFSIVFIVVEPAGIVSFV